MLERELQKAITAFLKREDILFVKHQNGLRALPQKGGGIITYRGGTTGMPDIEIYSSFGCVFFMELKSDTGKINDKQKIMFDMLKKINHNVFIIKPSIWEDIKDIYFGLKKQKKYDPFFTPTLLLECALSYYFDDKPKETNKKCTFQEH